MELVVLDFSQQHRAMQIKRMHLTAAHSNLLKEHVSTIHELIDRINHKNTIGFIIQLVLICN